MGWLGFLGFPQRSYPRHGPRPSPDPTGASGAPPPHVGRFRGQAVRLSLPWFGSGEWRARNPLRLHFGPRVLPGSASERFPTPAFVGRLSAGGGYIVDTSLLEPAAAAALLLLRLERLRCYLVRGNDEGDSAAGGALRVRVWEAEPVEHPVRLDLAGAEGFYGEAWPEVRELLRRASEALTAVELEELRTKAHDTRGELPAAFQEITNARDRDLRDASPGFATEEIRERFPLYIRFGDPPPAEAGGRSRDWRGGLERGASCFRARLEKGAYVIDASAGSGELTMFKVLTVEEGREPYLAEGTEIGVGGAGEPLLDATDLRLTPLPPGTSVRVSEEWQEVVTLAYAVDALRGFVFPPHIWRPPKEVTVRKPATRIPPRSVEKVLEAVRSLKGPGGRPRSELASAELSLHGEEHSKRVAVAGARLAQETPGSPADPLVVLLFALLHDAGRLRDAVDEHHALRGARLARGLLEGGPVLTERQLETLLYAIERHDSGETSDDPTVGVCFDSDRLNLWRVGVRPNPELLSTEPARSPEMMEWARVLQHERFAWEEIMQAYEGSAA